MEDTGQHVELVHVLRHTFRPSAELQASFEAFTKSGPTRPRFLIKTLSGIALDITRHGNYEFDTKINAATEQFRRNTAPLQLGSIATARYVSDGSLKLLLQAKDHSEFLNRTKYTRDKLVDDGLFLEDIDPEQYDLFVKIEAGLLVPKQEVGRAGKRLLDNLRNESRSRLYGMQPESISGKQELRAIIDSTQQDIDLAS